MLARTLTFSCASLVLLALTIAAIPTPGASAQPANPKTAPATPTPEGDLSLIARKTDAFAVAWNTHDAKGLAAIWEIDGDLIDPWGVTSVGRDNVEKFFAQQHTGTGHLAKSTYALKGQNVRIISPDVALSDWQVVLTDLIGPDGKTMGPMIHRVVIVWKKSNGQWAIAAARPGVPAPVSADATTPPKMPGK